ncbi:MAG: retropepsin-like aspartic protease [Bacteroidota bacterium]
MLNSNNNRPWPGWKCYVSLILLLAIFKNPVIAFKYKGFNFIDNKTECIISFELVDNLIVVPVEINKNIRVNLVLDTGGRSVILFGNNFKKRLQVLDREIPLQGYGRNRNKTAFLSLENEVKLGDALGQGISILVANGRYFFPYDGNIKIHGIIGYQVFSRFVVSIDYQNREIVLTEPRFYLPPADYTMLNLTLKDTKPYIKLAYSAFDNNGLRGYFHIDTGSSRGALLFLKHEGGLEKKRFHSAQVGKGINGIITGYKPVSESISIVEFQTDTEYYVIKRKFSRKEIQDAQGSIGSGLLKRFTVVLDYVNERFYFKSNA